MRKAKKNNCGICTSLFEVQGSSKKGESAWISFVMLMGFTVLLATLVYSWLAQHVKDTSADIKKVVYNYELCDYISVSIDDSYLNSETLYINITNRNNLRINALVLRVFDSTGLPKVFEQNVTIKPTQQKEIRIDLNMTNATIIEAVPIMYKDKLIVICTDKKVVKNI